MGHAMLLTCRKCHRRNRIPTGAGRTGWFCGACSEPLDPASVSTQNLDLYTILQVAPSAEPEVITAAYHRLVRKYHPDVYDGPDAHRRIVDLNSAYEVLSAPESRRAYDRGRSDEVTATRERTQASAQSDSGSHRRSPPTRTEPYFGCTVVQFEDMPRADAEALLHHQRDPTGRGVTKVRTGGPGWSAARVVGAVTWMCWLLSAAQTEQWGRGEVVWYAPLSCMGAATIWLGIAALLNYRRSPLRPYVLMTPLYIIVTDLQTVRYWPASAMQGLSATHHYTNGMYSRTSVTISLPDFRLNVDLRSRDAYEMLLASLRAWQAELASALRTGDEAYIRRWDWFAALEYRIASGQVERRTRLRRPLLATVRVGVLGLLCGLAWFGLAWWLNDYADDKRAYDAAATAPSARSFRSYLATRPTGRFAAEATSRIAALYRAATRQYIDRRPIGYDGRASDALVGLIDYARSTGHYKVRIVFERQNEIPKGIEDDLARSFGVSNVLPIGDSFSDQRMAGREASITAAVQAAFDTVMARDILALNGLGEDQTEPVFVIHYAVTAGRTLYYRESDASQEACSRPHYPGIGFSWSFQIRIPPKFGTTYSLGVTSRPADHISYSPTTYVFGGDGEKATIYDAMAQSAFDNFREVLIQRLGFADRRQAPLPDKERLRRKALHAERDELTTAIERDRRIELGLSDGIESYRPVLESESAAIDTARAALDETSQADIDAFNERVKGFEKMRMAFNAAVRKLYAARRQRSRHESRRQEIDSALE